MAGEDSDSMPYLNVVLYSAEVNWFCDNTVILRVVLKRERESGGRERGEGRREGGREGGREGVGGRVGKGGRERGSGREGEGVGGGREGGSTCIKPLV